MSLIPRKNWIMAEMVSFALTLASFKGVRAAADFMRSHSVPLDVARRVLTTEDHR